MLFVFPNLAYRGSGVSGNLYLKETNLGRLIEAEDFPSKRDGLRCCRRKLNTVEIDFGLFSELYLFIEPWSQYAIE